MRISDWSSDVCPSDLFGGTRRLTTLLTGFGLPAARSQRDCLAQGLGFCSGRNGRSRRRGPNLQFRRADLGQIRSHVVVGPFGEGDSFVGGSWRSEEHTSELQSLMRISYAVFCLKKKN